MDKWKLIKIIVISCTIVSLIIVLSLIFQMSDTSTTDNNSNAEFVDVGNNE